MFERTYEYFLSEPRRLIDLGKAVVNAGGFLLVLGAIGHAATGAASVAQSFGKQMVSVISLSDLYPAIPTWFVPESIIGCVPAVLSIIAGLSIRSLGQRLKRAYL